MHPATLFALILLWGIVTMPVPGRWALSAFQLALFAYAAARIVRRRALPIHTAGVLLSAAALIGLIQLTASSTVDPYRTLDAVLIWITNAAACCLALDLLSDDRARDRFLHATLWFAAALAVVATLTAIASPPGRVLWVLDTGSDQPTLGPFVYRNQYAAFVEAVLPLALIRALLDRRRALLYTAIAALLFGSVVAAGSRAGLILCGAELLLIPAAAFARKLISAKAFVRAVAGSAAAAALLAAIVGWQYLAARLQEPNPYGMRRELALSSLAMIRDRPLAGFGLGTWSSAYPAYARYDDGTFVNQAHNDWLQWTVEGGIPLLLLMLAFVAITARPALRSMWGIGMLIVFVHCLVDYPMQQRPALAAFFFAMLGACLRTPPAPSIPSRAPTSL